LCAIPAAETFLTLGRRYINNQPFFAPDRSHIHHVLLLRGVSVPRATLVLVLMQVLFVAAAISITRLQGPWVLAPLGVAILTGVLGLRWLNYMELRVLWHRVLHRLLHRRRQKYGHIMALANAGEHLAAVDSTAEVAGRLQAVVDDARLACLCVTLEPDIRAAIPEADRQILETPETSSTARALLNAEPFWMLGNATQEIDERTMERITFTYPLALGERLLGRVAIVRWQEPREVGPTSNDVRRYVADPLTRLLQRLIGADAPDEIESRTDRLDERVVIGAGVKE
jgi:hypothetical protein